MREISSKLENIVQLAENMVGFYEVEISCLVRLNEGSESFFIRIQSDICKKNEFNNCRQKDNNTKTWF